MKLLAHVMPWFGDGNIHRMDRYVSNIPSVITRQLDVMQATVIFGMRIEGVIVTWQGPLATFQHSATTEIALQCGERGMLFALLLDPWCAKLGVSTPLKTMIKADDLHESLRLTHTEPDSAAEYREAIARGAVPNYTQNVINALNDKTAKAMWQSSTYLPEKYVLDFDTGANLITLAETFPEMQFLHHSVGFSWITVDMNVERSSARNIAAVADLKVQNANPEMRIPGISYSFNDAGMPTPAGVSLAKWTGTRDNAQSVWGGMPARVLDDQGGNFFFDQLGVTPMNTPYLGLVTWNDYDERTEIEAMCSVMAGIQI